jgi:ATP-dependent exoDNAse (exonuclease V) alpha subunit
MKEVKLMAIFHSHIQIITRGKGKSALAASAYRAGELIKNEYDGEIHDYTHKKGILHTEVLLPAYAPEKYRNRTVLWNEVERVEKSVNSQLAREIDIALPIELTQEQNIALIRDYVKRTFVDSGMCADLCVHDTVNGNPHAHIMLTMRPINDNGTWGNKQKKEYILDNNNNKIYDPKKRQYKCRSIPSTDWNEQSKADEWRKAWEDAANTELKRLGFETRIDRRTLVLCCKGYFK